MKAFDNAFDIYIANDENDLQKVIAEQLGPEEPFDLEEWIELSDDKQLSISFEPPIEENYPRNATVDKNRDGWPKVTARVADWIDFNGRGMLSSTEH